MPGLCKPDQLAPPLVEKAASTRTVLPPPRLGSFRTQADARIWGFAGLMATDGVLSSPVPLETSTRFRIVAAGRVASRVRGSSPSRATRRREDLRVGRGRNPNRRGRTVEDLTAGASGRMATSFVRPSGRHPRAAGGRAGDRSGRRAGG